MKKIIVLLLITFNICLLQGFNFKGNVNYLQDSNKNLTSNNNIEYSFKLYEDHIYIVSLSNALGVDLDCFKNEIKETNVFTTLKIEF